MYGTRCMVHMYGSDGTLVTSGVMPDVIVHLVWTFLECDAENVNDFVKTDYVKRQ